MDNPAIIVVLAVVVAIIVLIVRYMGKESKFEDLLTNIYEYVDSMIDLYHSGVSIIDEVVEHSLKFAESLGLKVNEEDIRKMVDEYLHFLDDQTTGDEQPEADPVQPEEDQAEAEPSPDVNQPNENTAERSEETNDQIEVEDIETDPSEPTGTDRE